MNGAGIGSLIICFTGLLGGCASYTYNVDVVAADKTAIVPTEVVLTYLHIGLGAHGQRVMLDQDMRATVHQIRSGSYSVGLSHNRFYTCRSGTFRCDGSTRQKVRVQMCELGDGDATASFDVTLTIVK